MAVVAKLNNLRIAPRKVRLVANLLKGMSVDHAVSELHFLSKASARPLIKLLEAAAADAENNFQLAKGDLIVKSMIVNAAPTYKRFMPRAFGRAATIRKRGSNVTLTLESRTGAKVSKPAEKVKEEKTVVEKTAPTAKHEHGPEAPVAKKTEKHSRRLFNRKSG